MCVVCAVACSGPRFTPVDCRDSDCAGASSGGSAEGGAGQGGASDAGAGGEPSGGSNNGGSNNGGSNNGGSNNGGSNNGGSNNGGSSNGGSSNGGSNNGGSGGAGTSGSNSGGAGTSGSAGAAGTGSAGFPATPVLDDFNRDTLELGDAWIGATERYEIGSKALYCAAGYCQGVFWDVAFATTQEVFATYASFSEYSPEINLVFKAQGDLDCNLVELFYSPPQQRAFVDACWDGSWISFGGVDVRLEPGDQLGGRFGADGFIDVFRNGELLMTVDARDYPFADGDGYIGINGVVGEGEDANVWDDFGGGSLEP
jgi:hypothetical protein